MDNITMFMKQMQIEQFQKVVIQNHEILNLLLEAVERNHLIYSDFKWHTIDQKVFVEKSDKHKIMITILLTQKSRSKYQIVISSSTKGLVPIMGQSFSYFLNKVGYKKQCEIMNQLISSLKNYKKTYSIFEKWLSQNEIKLRSHKNKQIDNRLLAREVIEFPTCNLDNTTSKIILNPISRDGSFISYDMKVRYSEVEQCCMNNPTNYRIDQQAGHYIISFILDDNLSVLNKILQSAIFSEEVVIPDVYNMRIWNKISSLLRFNKVSCIFIRAELTYQENVIRKAKNMQSSIAHKLAFVEKFSTCKIRPQLQLHD